LSPSVADMAQRQDTERIIIGKVGAPHGVRGEVRIIPETDFPERFRDMKEVQVGDELLHITSVKYHGNVILMAFREYQQREQVAALNGRLLTVARSEAVPLEEGTYYISDIVGLRVFDTAGQEIGVVDDVFQTGANDVYQVRQPDGHTRLLAAIHDVVKEIDVPGGRMVVDVPEEI